jgi:type I protein arginine methyltransferase
MLGINQLEILNYHRFLLTRTADRLERYQRAIERVVSPGDVVIDLGSGTGILGLLALRAGASRIYAIEESPALDLSRALAAAHGVENRFVFFNCRSTLVDVPEPADVLIADIGDLFVMEPGGLRAIHDARERMLKASATIIPASVEFFIAAVEVGDLYQRTIEAWKQPVCGVDLSNLRPYAVNNFYQTIVGSDALLGEGISVARVCFGEKAQEPLLSGTVNLTISRSGVVHGMCGWFSTRLAADVMVDNVPAKGTTNYPQAYFPISTPVAVERGDTLRVSLQSYDAMELRWSVEARRDGKTIACFDHSTLHGFPLFKDRLRAIAVT